MAAGAPVGRPCGAFWACARSGNRPQGFAGNRSKKFGNLKSFKFPLSFAPYNTAIDRGAANAFGRRDPAGRPKPGNDDL